MYSICIFEGCTTHIKKGKYCARHKRRVKYIKNEYLNILGKEIDYEKMKLSYYQSEIRKLLIRVPDKQNIKNQIMKYASPIKASKISKYQQIHQCVSLSTSYSTTVRDNILFERIHHGMGRLIDCVNDNTSTIKDKAPTVPASTSPVLFMETIANPSGTSIHYQEIFQKTLVEKTCVAPIADSLEDTELDLNA